MSDAISMKQYGSKVFNEDLSNKKLSDHLNQLYNFLRGRDSSNNIDIIKEIIMNSEEIPIDCIYKLVHIISRTGYRLNDDNTMKQAREMVEEIGKYLLDYIAKNIELDLEIFLKNRSIIENITLQQVTNPLFINENNNQAKVTNVRFSINEAFLIKCYNNYKNPGFHLEKRFRYLELSMQNSNRYSSDKGFQDIIIKSMDEDEINNYIEFIPENLSVNIPENYSTNIISRLISDETYFKNKKGYLSTTFRKIIEYFPNISFNNCEYLVHCYNIVGWDLTKCYIDRLDINDICDSLYKILQKTTAVSSRKFDIIEKIIKEIIIRKDNKADEYIFDEMIYNSNILNKLCRKKSISDYKISIIKIFMKYNLVNLDFQEKTRAKHKTLRAIMENHNKLNIFTDFDDNNESTFMKSEFAMQTFFREKLKKE